MAETIGAADLRAELHGTGEVALLDVREAGQIAEGHILFSAPLPYSRFETGLGALVPRRDVALRLCDGGGGVARRAAARARAMGYSDVRVLEGGVAAWAGAGHPLYDGVNVPSKVFGELVEHAADTPRLPAAEVAARQARGERMVIVDGRPLEEYARFNIPGATCCPNGELALRIGALVPDAETTVVVNCAGRTRSIIGAQTLIDLGLPNPVYAMENGTQGWTLAGLEVERGRTGTLVAAPAPDPARRARAEALAERHGAVRLDRAALAGWLADAARTVYLLDVRTAEERAADAPAIADLSARHGVVHAPGGQLVQATDQWVGVRRARLVVLDTEGVRAPVVAAWLARLGHAAAYVEGGLHALRDAAPRAAVPAPAVAPVPEIAPEAVAALLARGAARVLDLRASAAYRAAHVPGAHWSIRPRLAEEGAGTAGRIVLVADTPEIAALAAVDLAEAGASDIAALAGGMAAWTAAGMEVESTPDSPPDAHCIDFVFHTHGRHDGNDDASRAYLSWEIALVDRLDAEERAVFRV